MTDLIRTKCGRIQYKEKPMLNTATLTSCYITSYRNLFSPLTHKTLDFVQKPMGYHSDMFAYFKVPNVFKKMIFILCQDVVFSLRKSSK